MDEDSTTRVSLSDASSSKGDGNTPLEHQLRSTTRLAVKADGVLTTKSDCEVAGWGTTPSTKPVVRSSRLMVGVEISVSVSE